jgi:hypothetical protein
MSKFERRIAHNGSRIQIWDKKAGGNWDRFVDRDDYREQYGPYAW